MKLEHWKCFADDTTKTLEYCENQRCDNIQSMIHIFSNCDHGSLLFGK